jgi:hypothetical protein
MLSYPAFSRGYSFSHLASSWLTGSGRSSGGIHWQEPANINRTIAVLGALAKEITAINAVPATHCVVSGLELLNEPWTPCVGGPISLTNTLLPFYERAYAVVRAAFDGDVLIHDGFCEDDPVWDGALAPPAYERVLLDTHIYHCFGGPRQQPTPWAHVAYTCLRDRPFIAGAVQRDWTVVGEWSCATGLPSAVPWLAAFHDAQWQAYCSSCVGLPVNPGRGAFFWNFKIEQGYAEWDYLGGLKAGWAYNFTAATSPAQFSCADTYDTIKAIKV